MLTDPTSATPSTELDNQEFWIVSEDVPDRHERIKMSEAPTIIIIMINWNEVLMKCVNFRNV